MTVQGTTTHRPWVGRASALLLVGLGLYSVKWCVLDVLAAAKRHETVALHTKLIFFVPSLVILGLIATVASFTNRGNALGERLSNTQTRRLRPMGWLIVFALLALGGGLYLWLRNELEGYGYEF